MSATRFIFNQAKAWTKYLERFDTHGGESYSGWGSHLDATVDVRQWLPEVIERYGVKTMLDAPCGDLNWLQHLDLGEVEYMGYDVEPSIVGANQARFPDKAFRVVNLLTTSRIPKVDLILCRDFLFHIPNDYIAAVLAKFKASQSRYLIATNHPGVDNDRDCPIDGGHDDLPGYYCASVDLEAEPFNLKGRCDSVTENREGHQELVMFDLRAP